METFIGLSFIIVVFILLPLLFLIAVPVLVYQAAKKTREEKDLFVEAAKTIIKNNTT